MRGWTTERLERALRKRIREHPLKIAPERLSDGSVANVHWEGNGERARIKLDPMQVSWLRAVIHELLHLELYEELKSYGDMEEAIVEALESHLCDRIEGSRRRLSWWHGAISAKAGGHVKK
jgi:hypothetical protein